MTTGSIILPVLGAILPDGSTNNAAPQYQRTKGSAASSSSVPASFFAQLLFDPSTNQHAFFSFRMPTDYASGPVIKLQWGANATTGNVVWEARLGVVNPGDVDTPNEHALAAANSVTTAVNATEARRLVESSITMTNADSLGAGKLVILMVKRDAANASDTCTASSELSACTLEYTTV
jgi:hypothetical protein